MVLTSRISLHLIAFLAIVLHSVAETTTMAIRDNIGTNAHYMLRRRMIINRGLVQHLGNGVVTKSLARKNHWKQALPPKKSSHKARHLKAKRTKQMK